MAERPHVICLTMVSLDGRIHPSRWTTSPDGERADWTKIYEGFHEHLQGDAWLVGRVTMAEMSQGVPQAPAENAVVARPYHFAKRDAEAYAVALDRDGRLHFGKADIGGDHVVVLLGHDVPDRHLAELAASGVSYIVAADHAMQIAPLLAVLRGELGVRRLLLEGGGHINGSMMQAGLIDELSLLVAPAIDGGEGVTGVFDAGADGLAGKVQLHFLDARTLDHGVVHLRYAVTPT